MNLRELDLRIVTEPPAHAAAVERRGREGLVTYESSAYLTSAHIDVTSSPTMYARAKAFHFPSKRQLRAMDADRWVRQRVKAANLVDASELPPVHFSLDYLHAPDGCRPLNRSTVDILHNAFSNASRRFPFTRRIVR